MTTADITERALRWAEARPVRVRGHNPWAILVRTARSSAEDRVTGLAAEMAFFGLLSLVPVLVALGAALGYLERIIGAEPVAQGQRLVLQAVDTVFSPQISEDVMRPLIDGLLAEQRGGLAISGLLVAVWLSSRVFTAMIRALDLAYGVDERRGVIVQRLLAVAFTFGFLVVLMAVLGVVVAGPLLGGGQDLADRLGMGSVFAALWSIARWPAVVLAAIACFCMIYHLGPNAPTTWRGCLPGAVVGVLLWIAVSLGLRVYLSTLGAPGTGFARGDEAFAALGGVIGAVVAVVLWTYLSSLALLLGGELNSELDASRRRRGS